MCICFLGNIGPKAVREAQICIADANATPLKTSESSFTKRENCSNSSCYFVNASVHHK